SAPPPELYTLSLPDALPIYLELIERLAPTRTLLVADAGLGTLNLVRLCLRALGEKPTLVFLNRFDPDNDLHRRNWQWLNTEGVQLARDVPEALAQLT